MAKIKILCSVFLFHSFQLEYREGGDYWLFINFTSYDHEHCGVLLTNDPPAAEMRT